MNSARLVHWILPVVITLLAVADGGLHLTLDVLLFRGNFIGPLGPPPGGAAPPPGNRPPGPPVLLPFQLNQMFVLNSIGYLVLIVLFWFAIRRFPAASRWIDRLMLLFVVCTFVGWLDYGAPNPMGLGYLSKAFEIGLAVALIAYLWLQQRTTGGPAARRAAALAR